MCAFISFYLLRSSCFCASESGESEDKSYFTLDRGEALRGEKGIRAAGAAGPRPTVRLRRGLQGAFGSDGISPCAGRERRAVGCGRPEISVVALEQKAVA